MRMLRGLLAAVAVAGLLPRVAEAQEGRRFENAWFWGIKGGGMSFSTYEAEFDAAGELAAYSPRNRNAGTLGAEWLITRTRGGVYLSYDQGFVSERAAFRNTGNTDSAIVFLGLENTRRVNIAGMFFPEAYRWMQPYAGVGFAYMQIGATSLLNPDAIPDAEDRETFDTFVVENKSQFQPLGILGVQGRLKPFSVFLQGSVTPFREDFLLRGGRNSIISYEIGIRYNIGSSIERL